MIERMTVFRNSLRASAAAVIVAAGVSVPVTASAASAAAPLGGGSGIMISESGDFAGANVFLCSLAAVGSDQNGDLKAITAGHCGEPEDKVAAENFPELGEIGEFEYSTMDPDIAVIDLDDDKVQLLNEVGGLAITGISSTTPVSGEEVCKNGRSTGVTCGIVWGSNNQQILEHSCSVGGDSGGAVVRGNELVGLISGGPRPWCNEPLPAPFHAPNWSTEINAGLAKVQADTGIEFSLYTGA